MSITINKELLRSDELEQLDKINKIYHDRIKYYENINTRITKSNNELGFKYFKFIDRKSIICDYSTYNILNDGLENIDDVNRWITYQTILKELTDKVFKPVLPPLTYKSYYKSVHMYSDMLCIDYIIEVNAVKYTIGFLCDKIYKIQVGNITFNTSWYITTPNLQICFKDMIPIIYQLNKIDDKESFVQFFDTSTIEITNFLDEFKKSSELFIKIKSGVAHLDTIKTKITYKNTYVYAKLYLQVGVLNLEYTPDNINSLIRLLNNIQLDTK